MKIKKDDNIIIISGKDKGSKGKVTRVFPKTEMVLVEGFNMRKKHQKPRKANQKGQTLEYATPMHVSNVMLVDPKGGARTRIGFSFDNGKKVKIAKKSGTII